MPGFFRNLSIRNKLVVAMLMASLVTLALVTTVAIVWDNQNLEKAALEQASAISRSLTQNFLKMHLLDTPEAAADTVSVLRSFPEINQVYLFNLNGEIIFQYHKQDEPVSRVPDIKTIGNLNVGSNYLHVLQPIVYSKQEYGKAYLKLEKVFI